MARSTALVDSVADSIAKKIAVGGEYRDVHRWITPARTIAEREGVHRSTVARALAQLAERGVVVLVPNQGAKVAQPKLVVTRTVSDILTGVGEWRGFPASVVNAGGTPFNDIVSAREVAASAVVSDWLGITEGTAVYERVREQGAVEDGVKVLMQMSWSWFTMRVVDDVPAIRSTPTSGPSRIRARVVEAGYRPRYEHEICGRFADDSECELFGLDAHAVLLDVWRTCVDDRTGETIEVTRMIDDAQRVKLRY